MHGASPLRIRTGAALPAPEAHSDAAHTSLPPHQFWRLWLVVAGVGFLALIVTVRLLHHQIIGWLVQPATPTYSSSGLPRGVIVDRNGELLAADRFFYRVVADPANIQNEQDRLAVANTLQELIGAPAAETHARLFNHADSRYMELVKQVSLVASQQVEAYKASAIEENGASPWQHIYVVPAPTRYYPQGRLASHVLGFVQANRTGVYGLEGYYDSFLNPQSGIGLLARTNNTLMDLAPDLRRFVPSMGGKDLVLTLDSGVQWIIEEELQRAIVQYRAKSGTIIVMEPHSGAILGMTSWPGYDPNNYGQQPDFSLFVDPAISLLYEPGSIFKVVTMAAALDAGIIAPTTMYTDSGSVTVGQRLIFNSNRVGYGLVSATDALARSLNVVTAQIAVQLGSEKFYRYVERFGFNQLTEVDLAGEVSGLVKTPGDPLWSLSDLGTNSFGQGLAVTPLEMLNAVAAIANGGFLIRPHIVQARVEEGRVLYTRPTVVRPVIKPETARVLTEMMVETVRTGNAAAGIAGYRIAGKSGTAQIPGEGGYLRDATIVSFIGFAPADDPRFVVLIKLDQPDPNISIWATHTAAPVFAQVARRLLDHLSIPPDAIRLGPERVAEIAAESTRILSEKLPED
jgi:cell division protein FtsI/penicillin-binding protein 2